MALNQTDSGAKIKLQTDFPLSDVDPELPNTQGAGIASTEQDDFIIYDKANNAETDEYVPRSQNRESGLMKARVDKHASSPMSPTSPDADKEP